MMMKLLLKSPLVLLSLLFNGCAVLHHVQVGEVDSQTVLGGRRFEIIVSETGIDLKEATEWGKALVSSAKDVMHAVQAIVLLTQMGPRTGGVVFSEDYADKIFDRLEAECPNGRVSGLTSVREMTKYPVISGEIVKIIGYCQKASISGPSRP